MQWLDRIPLSLLILASLLLGLAPFVPQPHLAEKIMMLHQGKLTRLIDIFDLAFHSFPVLLLIVKIIRTTSGRKQNEQGR